MECSAKLMENSVKHLAQLPRAYPGVFTVDTIVKFIQHKLAA